MKTFIDDNFLGGKLEVIIDSDKRKVYGFLRVYMYEVDSFITFSTEAFADAEDKFSEKSGVNLVKLKLARKVHLYKRLIYRIRVKNLSESLKFAENEFNRENKKVESIESELKNKYELSFPTKNKKKKVKKVVAPKKSKK